MYRRKIIYLILFLFSFLFIAKQGYTQDIKMLGIDDFKLNGIQGNEITISFTANIENATRKTLKVKIKEGKLHKNNKLAGTFEFSESIKIRKKSVQKIPVTMRVKTESGLNLLGDGLSLMFGNTVSIKASGVVKGRWLLFTKKFPFEVEEKLSLRDLGL